MPFKEFISKTLTFIRLAFSEHGYPSSKRILAGLMLIVVLFCTAWSVCSAGMTENNRGIIEFEIVTAGALLGVTSITAIWKQNGGRPNGLNNDIGMWPYPEEDKHDCDNEEKNK